MRSKIFRRRIVSSLPNILSGGDSLDEDDGGGGIVVVGVDGERGGRN